MKTLMCIFSVCYCFFLSLAWVTHFKSPEMGKVSLPFLWMQPDCCCFFLRKMCNTRNLLFVMSQWERYPYASPSVRCLSLTLNLDLQPPSFFLFSKMQKLKKTHRVQAFYAGGCKPKAVDVCGFVDNLSCEVSLHWSRSWPIEELKIGGVVWGKLLGPQRCKTKLGTSSVTLLMRFHIREAGPVSHSTHILFYTQPWQLPL